MNLVSQNEIYRGTPQTPSASCCFPGIARLPDGTLLATLRTGSSKDSDDGTLLLSRSADGGASWSSAEPFPLGPYAGKTGEVHYGPLTVLGPNHLLAALLWVDRSEPGLPLFHPQTEGLLPISTILCESFDGGDTWVNYREMDSAPYNSPMPITGPVLDLQDGRLACQFEVNKHYHDTRPWRHAAAWKISSDGGYTWPDCVEIANDPSGRLMYWDARYAVAADGLCAAAFWTYDRLNERDAKIHLSFSSDGGRHWTPPTDSGITGQICQPLLLSSGQLLLIYVDRFISRSIRAVLSNDLGNSIDEQVVVYEHAPLAALADSTSSTADYLQEMNIWTFGRVEGLVDFDGAVSLVYYAGTGTPEATSIFWAQLAAHAAVPPRMLK